MDPVGVDFGTATTLVAQHRPSGPAAIVPLGRSRAWLPSLAHAVADGHRSPTDGAAIVVGEDTDAGLDGEIRSVKRAITERRDAVTAPMPDGSLVSVAADAVIAAILTEAARRAESAGVSLRDGRPVRLGCPVLWDGPQRRRLLDVASGAGLAVDESRLVEEPVAAGLAWLTHAYLAAGQRPSGRLLVFDMGGGTLDVAVMDVAAGPRPRIRVLAAAGAAVAGDALDTEVARDIAVEMAARGADVTLHDRPVLAWALLERAAREAKTRLSHVDEHPVVLPPLLRYPHPVRYDRARLESALRGPMDGAETLALAALRAARAAGQNLTAAQLRAVGRAALADDVDLVLVVGGMSRVPYVRRRLARLFGRARLYHDVGVAAEEAVAAGLADAADHAQLTLHRPGFDLTLEFKGRRLRLYEAFTPLFEPWQLYSGYSDLGYERWVRPPEVPARGEGRVRAFGLYGREVGLAVDGRVGPLPVRFGPDGVWLRLGSDGTVELRDGHGVTALRVDGWPALVDGTPVPFTRGETTPSR